MIRHTIRFAALVSGAALALASLGGAPSFAQTPASGVFALTNARIIDGTGRPVIEQGTLLVSGGRITAVGRASVIHVPAGAQRIDAAGKTIVPGFINAHAHLNVDRGATMPVRDDLVRRLKMYADYGVTTTVSLGSTPADEAAGIALMQEQEHPGLDRARLYTAGLNAIGKTPEEARASVDRLADLKVFAIKYHINGNQNDMSEPTWSAIVDEARRKGLKSSVHVYYHKDAKASIDAGVNVIAHSIRDQDVTPELIAEMKRKNVAYIPTLTRDYSVFCYETTPAFLNDPFFRRGLSLYSEQIPIVTAPEWQEKVRKDPTTAQIKQAIVQAERNLKRLSDAGVTIAMGTDSGVASNPGRWQGYFEQVEMEMMAKAGMSPMKVLVASTGDAAKTWGLKELGTLEKGKWADFVVLNANPLQDIRNTRTINSVWIAGARLDGVAPVSDTQ